jgi:hypothetical protein
MAARSAGGGGGACGAAAATLGRSRGGMRAPRRAAAEARAAPRGAVTTPHSSAASAAESAAALRRAVSGAWEQRGAAAQLALLSLRRDASAAAALAGAVRAAQADALPLRALGDALWAAGALSAHSGACGAELDALSSALVRAVERTAAAAGAPAPAALPPRVAADAAWALGVAKHAHAPAFACLACVARAGGFASAAPRDAAVLLWASALLCAPEERVTADIAAAALLRGAPTQRRDGDDDDDDDVSSAAAVALAQAWAPRHLVLAAWSLAAADAEASPTFAAAWRALCAGGDGAAADDERALPPLSLTQLSQAALSAAQRPRLPRLPRARGAAAAAAWAARRDAFSGRAAAPTSALQADVGRALHALGRAAVPEALAHGGYRVDWDVPPRVKCGTRVLLEVDGPAHFPRNALVVMTPGDGDDGDDAHAPTPTPLGGTRLKRRQLSWGAQPVASLPYWAWEGARAAGDTARCVDALLRQAEGAQQEQA